METTMRRRRIRRVLAVAVAALFVFSGTAALAGSGNKAVVATLYGDGDINCPGHVADDLSTPVGKVAFRPTTDGYWMNVVLTNAAPNWEYNVAVNLDVGNGEDEDDCFLGVDEYEGAITTNSQGVGVFRASSDLFSGDVLIQVNIGSAEGVPPNPLHREISQASFVQITVP
jgi:hypothetical protein